MVNFNFRSLEIGIEEAILLFLITIEILDFFRIIPAELEFVEKTVAIITVLFLTYKVSLSWILIGERFKNLDILITAGFFFLGLRSALGFVISASLEQSYFQPFYKLVVMNISFLEKFSFLLGILIFIVISVIMIGFPIRKESFLKMIHEHGLSKTFFQKIARFCMIYL